MAAAKYRAYRLLRSGLGCFYDKHSSRDVWRVISTYLGNCVFLEPSVRIRHKIQQAEAKQTSAEGLVSAEFFVMVGLCMCNFCNCVRNLLCCNGNVNDNTSIVDDIETLIVCGNCQCGAADVCGCDTCANSAQNNTCGCGCGCSRCGCRCN